MVIGGQTVTRRLFLGCMGAIYVCAFASLYPQIPGECTCTPRGVYNGTRALKGLYGKDGLTPVHNVINEQRYKGVHYLWVCSCYLILRRHQVVATME